MLGRRRVAGFVVAASVAALVVPVVVAAPVGAVGEIVVTTTDDSFDPGDGVLSLREAIAEANATPGEDTVVLADGATYVLDRCGANEPYGVAEIERWDLDVTDPEGLVVVGNGATIEQVCEAVISPSAQALTVHPEAAGRLEHTTITGLDVGVLVLEADLILSDVVITGVYTGVALDASTLRLERVSMVGVGGGVDAWTTGPVPSTVTMVDSTISEAGDGLSFHGDLLLVRSRLDGLYDVAIDVSGSVEMVDSSASRNYAGVYGASSVELLRSRIDDNDGEGLWLDRDHGVDPVVTLRESSISGNRYGVDVEGATITVQDSVMQANWGGSISAFASDDAPTPTVLIERSTIAGGEYGIITDGSVTLRGSTVANNSGTGVRAASLVVESSTITGHHWDSPQSVHHEIDVGDLVARGSVIGEGRQRTPDCSVERVISSSHNVLGDARCYAGAELVQPPTDDLVGVAPRLGPLADNGGPSPTRLPRPSSPLLDAGPIDGCGLVDQRGVTRPQGSACDIGAVERELAPGAPRFADVPIDHLFFWDVECLVGLEVTEGFADGTFGPALPISRQGVVAWLWRLAGEPAPSGASPFSDVPASHLFHDAIVWAAEEGVATGFSDGTFRPGQSVSRQGVAAWLWRGAGSPLPAAPYQFADVPPGHPFADPIGWLSAADITGGFPDGTFGPTLPISRQGLAAWLCRSEDQGS